MTRNLTMLHFSLAGVHGASSAILLVEAAYAHAGCAGFTALIYALLGLCERGGGKADGKAAPDKDSDRR